MAKRSFSVDTSSLAAERPILEEGYYAGVLENAGVTMGSGDNVWELLNVQQATRRNSKTKKFEPIPGEYQVRGQFTFGATLISEKAKKVLQRDEPKVFGGSFYISFVSGADDDTENHKLHPQNNTVYKKLLETLGLQDENFDAEVDFEWDEDIATEENVKKYCQLWGDTQEEKDEEIAGYLAYRDIEAAMNAVVYYRKLFTVVADSVNGKYAAVKVVKQANRRTPSLKENAIGSDASFPGFLAYKEGSEFDLED